MMQSNIKNKDVLQDSVRNNTKRTYTWIYLKQSDFL